MSQVNIEAVIDYLKSLQNRICQGLEQADQSGKTFEQDDWRREQGGYGHTRVLTDGKTFEQAGVNFSYVHGSGMPASATENRPELAGRSFKACGVSLVIHPKSPYVPTTHANVRFFVAEKPGEDPIWWFGGGFDLTPYYPFDEDIIHWHQTAKNVCDRFNDNYYEDFKSWCDRYFYLRHRDETRGVGGIFFDDLSSPNFEQAFDFMKGVGDCFLTAYTPIVERRKDIAYGERERNFQLYRRGRYVEFNLVYDRGTLFGLQTGGRTESILMSMPPKVRWEYNYQPDDGSPEAKLAAYLTPRNWL